jgi:hypothetical protein
VACTTYPCSRRARSMGRNLECAATRHQGDRLPPAAYPRGVRYLGETFAVAALRRGRTIEQFLGQAGDSGTPGIRWAEIVPADDGYRVMLHTSRDVGGEHLCDLVEFPPLEESGEEDFGEQVAAAAEARDALDAARAAVGAAIGRWVNQGMAGDEYLDYVRAGRPRALPARG